MILDKEEHKEALLQLLKSSNFPGEQIEFVYELYTAISTAIIAPTDIRDSGQRSST